MLQFGLGLPHSPRGAAEDFLLDQLGKRSRSSSALLSSGGGDMETTRELADPPQVPVLIISEAETWDINACSGVGCGQFVDWDKMPELNQQPSASSQSLPQNFKELKKLARTGHWATNHVLRAQAYHHIIQHVPCRLVTPDALVYRDVASRLFGKQSVSSHPLPEFLGESMMPTYCLTVEGVTAVKKVLICLGNLFPDITYGPILPAVVALLLHYSEDEAQCFENISRLVACNDSHTSYIDQSFLAHQASCMTFGDLANKHCPAAHRLIASTSDNVFEVYSEWLGWIFGDLPFEYAIRVLDVYLLEGQKVLYRVALALLRQYGLSVTSGELNMTDIEGELKAFMQSIRKHVTADKLLERAFGIRLFSRKEIWLLQMANRKALAEKGITVVQRRFYSCCEGYEPTVLLLKTTLGEVCGAFLSSDWKERKKSGGSTSFFGTGECFVFSVRPEMERYEWVFIKKPELTKAAPRSPRQRSPSPSPPARIRAPPDGHVSSSNHLSVPVLERDKARLSPFLAIRHFVLPSKTASMFMSGSREGIRIGGGGGQALFIDADLCYGRTEHCETFDNPPLCQENFQVQLLEAWGFQIA
ncbi:TBC1 domain family member 24-like isoform X2 [Carettochelys insculpta]|uniref:TBC1 domain family member 24-like isoform X2 n=1 Tax=Carettochelys insculpta TaxID=44489 RepID=UPI003EB97908